jgi:hypothetical protein
LHEKQELLFTGSGKLAEEVVVMGSATNSDVTYEPELTGLLIVDPYNDFLSEKGKLFELCRSTLEANNVVEHMRQILAAARAVACRCS